MIQDQEPMRNVDSRIRLSRFDRCGFLFYRFSTATFSTASELPTSVILSLAIAGFNGKSPMNLPSGLLHRLAAGHGAHDAMSLVLSGGTVWGSSANTTMRRALMRRLASQVARPATAQNSGQAWQDMHELPCYSLRAGMFAK